MKNSEGYPDPTAGKAMANIRKDDHRADLVVQIIKAVFKLRRVSDGMYPA